MKNVIRVYWILTFVVTGLSCSAWASHFNCDLQAQADLRSEDGRDLIASAEVSKSFEILPGNSLSAIIDFTRDVPTAVGDDSKIQILLGEIAAQATTWKYSLISEVSLHTLLTISVSSGLDSLRVDQDNTLMDTFATEYRVLVSPTEAYRIRRRAAVICVEML